MYEPYLITEFLAMSLEGGGGRSPRELLENGSAILQWLYDIFQTFISFILEIYKFLTTPLTIVDQTGTPLEFVLTPLFWVIVAALIIKWLVPVA